MLPSEFRLRDSDSFRRAVRRGHRAGASGLVVHVAGPSPDPADGHGSQAPPRFGLVVSRAVGNAVTRNRVKRRLRHQLSGQIGLVPPGSVVVVRALPAAADLTSAELHAELDRCLVRATRRSTGGSTS